MKEKSLLVPIVSSLLAISVLLFVLIKWLKPDQKTEVEVDKPKQEQTTTVSTANSTTNQPTAPAISDAPNPSESVTGTGVENMPNSLQGTEVDGEIIIDENKQLVVTYGLRRMFDYFLSIMGEETIEQINTRVENYIRSRTPEPAASRAVEIYFAYTSYLKALTDVEKNYSNVQLQATQNGELDLALIKQRRNDMQQLRVKFFDKETIEAFFAGEDSFEDYTVSMLEIEKDETLTVEQKQQQKEEYISRMPDSEDKRALVEYRAQQENLSTLLERTEELKKKNASAQEIYNMRVELVGEAAAKRLAEVDEEEANFEQRFVKYQEQKQAIIAKLGKDSVQAKTEIDEMAATLFEENEIKRLDGYAAVRNAKLQADD